MDTGFIDIHTHHEKPGVTSPKMAGVHPWDAGKSPVLPDFAECEIVGETGLDYAADVDRNTQERVFRAHLEAAEMMRKPVVLHVVRSFEPVMKILSEYRTYGVVFHGFTGSVQQAKRAFDAGYYLSFGERSLRSEKSRKVITITPAHLIFCETDDNPDIDIEEIYKEVASLRGTTVEELRKQTADNYRKLMRHDSLA